MEQGYDVSMPLRHTSPYDMIVDTGDRLIKVQVKSTTSDFRDNRNSIKIQVHKQRNELYSVLEIDYIALYIHKFEGFFVFKYDEPKGSYRLNPEGMYKNHFNNFAFNL